MASRVLTGGIAVLTLTGLAPLANGQALNIDLGPYIFESSPPSAAFGAASNQAGVWTRVRAGSSDESVPDITGAATGVTISTQNTLSHEFTSAHTGEIAALLNGGVLIDSDDCNSYPMVRVALRGVTNGTYDVYVYGGLEWFVAVPLTVYSTGQSAYASMSGMSTPNQLVEGGNYTRQRVTVSGGLLSMLVSHELGDKPVYVSGIQVVPVSLETCPVVPPMPVAVMDGETATFTATVSGDIRGLRWLKDGQELADVRGISGSATGTLSLEGARASDMGQYALRYQCGGSFITTPAAALVVAPPCGSSDFNGDGDYGTDADIEAFFRVLGGGSC